MRFWPFSCAKCQAQEAEIAFLRNMLLSAKNIVREPVIIQAPALPPTMPAKGSVASHSAKGLTVLFENRPRNPLQTITEDDEGVQH